MVLSMAKNLPTRMEEYPSRYCPECGPEAGYMDVLLFMGVQADGYVCLKCKGLYDQVEGNLKRLAQVIA
jgi:hypothetical protein